MKKMSNAQYSAIKRILATFAELKIEGSPSVRTLNQQRIAKKLLKKLKSNHERIKPPKRVLKS